MRVEYGHATRCFSWCSKRAKKAPTSPRAGRDSVGAELRLLVRFDLPLLAENVPPARPFAAVCGYDNSTLSAPFRLTKLPSRAKNPSLTRSFGVADGSQ
ncbi:hypothetical protein DIPPA_16045 [Diplonema papillatum]|nr:hypothetical protein DIPPA_16045 [Diplonema papillatum]